MQSQLSSTKALQKLCKSSAPSSVRSFAKALPKALPRLCSTSARPVYWPRSEWSTQCAGVSPLKLCSKLSARSFTRSPIQSSKALLTRSTNILGRLYNRPYNRPYDQSPYNCLYERLYERLYKCLHDRPYERPYD